MKRPAHTTDSDASDRKWTLLLGLMVLVLLWVAAVELPDRWQRIAEARSAAEQTRARHAGALDQHENLQHLQSERDELSRRLARLAETAPAAMRPSVVLHQLEEAVRREGLALLELRPLDREGEAAYARLPIRMRVLGTFDGVHGFLRAVETGAAATRVREVVVEGGDASVQAEIILELLVVGRTPGQQDQPLPP